MLEAFGWGALAASALLVGAVVAYVLAPTRQVIAVVMALGSGLLLGSISFELVDDALETSTVAWVGLLVLVGAAVFSFGDWLLDRRGASERKDPTGKQADGSALAIVLGSILDGIPSRSCSASPSCRAESASRCSPASPCRTSPRGCPRRAA